MTNIRFLLTVRPAMTWAVLSGLLAVGIGVASAEGTRPQANPPAGDAAAREVIRKYVDARERGDAKGVAELFTADADQLTSSGEWRRGRDEVVRGSLSSSQRNAGRRTIEVERVRFVSADVAIADGRYEIAAAGAAPRRMWTSFVLRRERAIWRIAAIRNMLPAPTP